MIRCTDVIILSNPHLPVHGFLGRWHWATHRVGARAVYALAAVLVQCAKGPFTALQAAEGPSAANAVLCNVQLSTNPACGLASRTSGPRVTECPLPVS